MLPLAERRRIELDCEWPAAGTPPMPLQGDADLMTVLLRNLLDNAVRYAPEGSTVRMRFGADRLVVENDGAALPPDVLAHLGQRFHRVDGQARKRQRPGRVDRAAHCRAAWADAALPRAGRWAGRGRGAQHGHGARHKPPLRSLIQIDAADG